MEAAAYHPCKSRAFALLGERNHCCHDVAGESTGAIDDLGDGMKLEKVKKYIKIKWSLWKYATTPVVVFVATFACYVAGWRLLPDCPSALERSGAIATVIALLSALYDYQGVLRRSEQAAIEWANKAASGLPKTGPAALKDLTRRLKENTAKVDRVATVLQAITLAIATLVWGFGDLVTTGLPHR